MKTQLKYYINEHPFISALVFVSVLIILFAPIAAWQGAAVDYSDLMRNLVGLWFVVGLAYFINRRW